MIYFIILACVYLLVVGMLIYAWDKWEKPINDMDYQPTVNIIVSCRNESSHIINVIKDISKQQYPVSGYSLTIVDDSSEDDTLQKAKTACEKYLKCEYQLIDMKTFDDKEGKKDAISIGVAHTNAEFVLCTDADCRLSDDWLNHMIQPFSKPYVHFVAGPVVFDQNRWVDKLFHQEFLSLIGSGAASLALGLPLMANGANMAFRRTVFERIDPYLDNEHIPSGDDEFLLKKIHRAYKHSTCFLKDESAVVRSNPPGGIIEWFQQRKRWAAKWKHNKRWFEYFPPVFLFVFHLSLIMMTVLMLTGHLKAEVWFTTLMIRALVEFVLLRQVHEGLNQKFSWQAFIVWQFVYPIYAVCLGLLANFGNYHWKGRKYKI